MATVSKEDVDIHEVGKLIAAEPVFATRVLQLANSPLFALQRQVRTISHAIILLGLDRVKAITFTRALQDFVTPALKIKALRACWQNCLATALLAEKLARAARMDTDFAYVAGLVRDIGRLALLVKYPEPYSNLLAVSGEQQFDLLMMERELFDIDHCQAGAWLMQQLPFPPELDRNHRPASSTARSRFLSHAAPGAMRGSASRRVGVRSLCRTRRVPRSKRRWSAAGGRSRPARDRLRAMEARRCRAPERVAVVVSIYGAIYVRFRQGCVSARCLPIGSWWPNSTGWLGWLHGDDHLAACAAGFEITDRLGDAAQAVTAVDHRRDLARLDQFSHLG